MMQAEHISFIEKENHHSGRSPTDHQQQQPQQHQYHHFNSHDNMETTTTTTTTTTRPAAIKEDWIEKTAAIQQALATLITKTSCRLCHVYADKQLEFESRQEDYLAAAAAANATRATAVGDYTGGIGGNYSSLYAPVFAQGAASTGATLEVELYRQFLFDEDSVVTSLTGRDEEEEVVEEEAEVEEETPEQEEQEKSEEQQLHPLQLASSENNANDDGGQTSVTTSTQETDNH